MPYSEGLKQFGGPGSGRHAEGGGSKQTSSDIRSSVQSHLQTMSDVYRAGGSQTYVSSQTSPNMGERTFIDISNKDSKLEQEHSNSAQKALDSLSSDIRSQNPGSQTYVSSMKSPNMGTRTFMDVELSKS